MSLLDIMTKKAIMLDHFRHALEFGKRFVAIKVKKEGFPSDEIIINRHESIEDCIKYWENTYNDDLVHRYSPTVSIVSWFVADTYAEIQKVLD